MTLVIRPAGDRMAQSSTTATRRLAIAKILRCRDLGMSCSKEIRAETEEELLKLAAEHAEKDHGISVSNIPPSLLSMVKAVIKNE